MWHIFVKWYGATWPRHGLPRGTMFWFMVCKSMVESVGIEPWTSRMDEIFGKGRLPMHHTMVSYHITLRFIFKFTYGVSFGGVRAGA
jgi:hypothetical protein